MSLTVKRRNEIAWKFFVRHLKNNKIRSIEEYCDSFSREYKIPNNTILHCVICEACDEILHPKTYIAEEKLVASRNSKAWQLHILLTFKKGIKVGECSKREIGSKAGELGISANELKEYHLEIVESMLNIISKNEIMLPS